MEIRDRLTQSLSKIFRRNRQITKVPQSLYKGFITRINEELGLNFNGEVRFEWSDELPVLAATSGNLITLSTKWFKEHPEDIGAIVHEIVHVVMHCPLYDETNSWLIEGLADYVRDKLGYVTAWSSPKRGNPKLGYQQTAHFLLFLEERYGKEYIRELSRRLSQTGFIPEYVQSKLEEYLEEGHES